MAELHQSQLAPEENKFHVGNGADGKRAPFNSGAPIALIAYGPVNVAALQRAALGICLRITDTTGAKG